MFNLLCRNLTAAYLWWAGWFEEYGIIVPVKEGFLHMEIFQLVGVLWMVTSRKLIWLLDSVSAVNFVWVDSVSVPHQQRVLIVFTEFHIGFKAILFYVYIFP